MKLFSFAACIISFLALCACDNSEKTDNSKPYQTTDTNRVEPVNSPADSGHHHQ
jgi:hypothetical protein